MLQIGDGLKKNTAEKDCSFHFLVQRSVNVLGEGRRGMVALLSFLSMFILNAFPRIPPKTPKCPLLSCK